jgi:peptide/nickel transport system substrate-binding protein
MRALKGLLLGALTIAASIGGTAHAADTLRYGLEFDPAVLDTAVNGSYTDRIVFSSMCDQLMDIDAKLNYVPVLATSWEWAPDNLSLTLHLRDGVTFQDGTPFDATAMRDNIERYRTAPYSLRRNELKPVASEDVIDRLTLRINLSVPYAPLLSLLANRDGVPLSPKILNKTSDEIAANPICTGPFRFNNRVAQDHILLDRYPGYWNAKNIHFDHILFRTIVDGSVRLVNLQSGALDMVNRLAPTDANAVKSNGKLRLVTSPSLGYQLLVFNVAHGPASDNPFSRDARVRQAFEKSIDRAALNQVVFDGIYVPSNQTEAPGSRYWNSAHPVPGRDLAGARALLKQAGITGRIPVSMTISNDPINSQVGQVIQSMAAEAGFDVTLQQQESSAMVAAGQAGDFQISLSIWSGRPDPDGNASIWMTCTGFLNWGKYCNKSLDTLFAQAAGTPDPDKRVPVYRQISDTYLTEMPDMVLFHFTWLWAMSDKVGNFVPMPDGLMRPAGMTLKN